MISNISGKWCSCVAWINRVKEDTILQIIKYEQGKGGGAGLDDKFKNVSDFKQYSNKKMHKTNVQTKL